MQKSNPPGMFPGSLEIDMNGSAACSDVLSRNMEQVAPQEERQSVTTDHAEAAPRAAQPLPPADVLAYMEQQALANGRWRMEAMASVSKRAHDLTMLLLGGAGSLGAFGVGRLEVPLVSWPLLAASAWAFVAGGLVAWNCLRTRQVWPLNNEPKHLWSVWYECMAAEKGAAGRAADSLRAQELFRVQESLHALTSGNASAAKWLNRGYTLAALLPMPAATAALLAIWQG